MAGPRRRSSCCVTGTRGSPRRLTRYSPPRDSHTAHSAASAAGERDLRAMIGTLRRELLDPLLIVNERHLHRVVTVYVSHFNACRPHRSLAQLAPAQVETGPPEAIDLADYRVRRRPILDGLTSEYHRAA